MVKRAEQIHFESCSTTSKYSRTSLERVLFHGLVGLFLKWDTGKLYSVDEPLKRLSFSKHVYLLFTSLCAQQQGGVLFLCAFGMVSSVHDMPIRFSKCLSVAEKVLLVPGHDAHANE